MSRILYFANGSLPDEKLPNLGADARVIQVCKMLADEGHEVVLSADLSKYQTAKQLHMVPQGVRDLSHTLHPMPEIFERTRPDIVYFGAFVPYLEPWVPPIPTIVEMGGPTLVEAAFIEGAVGPEIFGYFSGELNALAKGDLIVVYGERQQWYYRIPLALAGYRLDLPPPVVVVPNAIDEALIQPRSLPNEPRFVYSGGLYPWTDPTTGILEVLDAIDTRGRGEFHFIGGPNRPFPLVDERMQRIRQRMAASQRARQHGFHPYPVLVELLRTMSVSIELMSPNCERDLALPFRTPLALGCGLPVILADHAEVAGLVRSYDAGWVGPPEDRAWLRSVLSDILSDAELLLRKSQNAQRLAREHFTYAAAVRALRPFLASPTRREAPYRHLANQDHFTWWSPSEKKLLRRLRHPLLRPIRAVLARVLGRR